MRFVIKPDKDKTAKLKSPATYAALLDIAKNKNKGSISDDIYRDSYDNKDEKRSRVEDNLALSYKNKCGYCERLAKADIEHYRPKASVSDEKHDGYYWLCYEWTNLLPACVKCNRDGAKLTKFPIIGKRVTKPTFKNGKKDLDLDSNKAALKPLIDEIPYLLHPEIDKPEDFFVFEIDPSNDGIRLKGIDKKGRGGKTIEICLLNRQELRLERREKVIDGFVDAVNCAFESFNVGASDLNELKDRIINQIEVLIAQSKSNLKTHTYLRKYIVQSRDNFEKIVGHYLEAKTRKIVYAAIKTVILK